MKELHPRVTIALPVYNGELFLVEAIESQLAQTFTDFELVISDNGSTDGTEEICRTFLHRDTRVTYYRSSVNRGAAWNYNRLFRLTCGNYFKWAAHDDIYAPTFLARCVSVLDERPDVSLCYTGAVDIDERGDEVKPYPPLVYPDELALHERVRAVILNPSPCFESFGLMRRDQLRRTGLIGAYTSSDRTLILELAMQGKFHQIQDTLFFHRQHPDRSMFRYPKARGRNAWFDPNRAHKFTFPKWRLLAEYARAIERAPISAEERLRCMVHLARWTVKNRGVLARELAARLRYAGRLEPHASVTAADPVQVPPKVTV